MKLGITTIAYNQPQALLKMARTAVRTAHHDVQFHLFLHSPIATTVRACEMVAAEYDTVYYPIRKNVGVARSWNSGILSMIEHECDVLMICNDDVWFGPGDIDKMIDASGLATDAWAAFCSGFHVGRNMKVGDHGMSCFILNAVAIDTMGMFDQNFFPAYNEDIDYAYRAKLAGLDRITVPDLGVRHVGSATIGDSPQLRRQNHETHGKNDNYWLQKWGAPKPKAVYKRPFNKKNYHPYYISPQNRAAPYPGRNREDKKIVRF